MLHDGAMLMPDVENKPLCIDLFCGLGGWAEGFLAEGWRVIGFDIERHDYGTGGYPGQLVLQDVRTLSGSQFKRADLLVGSSPCQEFSYRAQPWNRGKNLPPPELGVELFRAQFRLQREASQAAGRYVPMIVENVRSAQEWVGSARWHHGSYYLWGDIPAVMPDSRDAVKVAGISWSGYGTEGYKAQAFNSTLQRRNGLKDKGAASAIAAKIPLSLSRRIAQVYKPVTAGR